MELMELPDDVLREIVSTFSSDCWRGDLRHHHLQQQHRILLHNYVALSGICSPLRAVVTKTLPMPVVLGPRVSSRHQIQSLSGILQQLKHGSPLWVIFEKPGWCHSSRAYINNEERDEGSEDVEDAKKEDNKLDRTDQGERIASLTKALSARKDDIHLLDLSTTVLHLGTWWKELLEKRLDGLRVLRVWSASLGVGQIDLVAPELNVLRLEGTLFRSVDCNHLEDLFIEDIWAATVSFEMVLEFLASLKRKGIQRMHLGGDLSHPVRSTVPSSLSLPIEFHGLNNFSTHLTTPEHNFSDLLRSLDVASATNRQWNPIDDLPACVQRRELGWVTRVWISGNQCFPGAGLVLQGDLVLGTWPKTRLGRYARGVVALYFETGMDMLPVAQDPEEIATELKDKFPSVSEVHVGDLGLASEEWCLSDMMMCLSELQKDGLKVVLHGRLLEDFPESWQKDSVPLGVPGSEAFCGYSWGEFT